MTNNKTSLYTPEEEKNLEKLIDQFDNNEITEDEFSIRTSYYFRLCEERKNRIRNNKITPLDKVRGFTPENFPYLVDNESD
jgi:hypothetical protein